MSKKRYTEEQIIGFLKAAESGRPVAELCRQHGFSNGSFYAWKKKFGGRFSILPRMKKYNNAQELLAFGMMDDQLIALGTMAQHPVVDKNIRNAAGKLYNDIIAESKKNDAKANEELRKLRINPRIKMWEFLSAGKEVEKSDDGLPTWFNSLKMAGAVTSTSSGTKPLFNVRYSGRKEDDEEE